MRRSPRRSSPSTWNDLTDTTAGLAVLARLVLVVASAWVAFGPERAVDEATQIPALLAPALAVASFGFTRSVEGIDLLLVPAGVLHAIAFAVWFGGLVLLSRVVLAGSGGQDLVDAVRGFGRLATISMIAVLLSGVVLTIKLLGGIGALFDTGFGRLLLLKAVLVAAIGLRGDDQSSGRPPSTGQPGRAQRADRVPAPAGDRHGDARRSARARAHRMDDRQCAGRARRRRRNRRLSTADEQLQAGERRLLRRRRCRSGDGRVERFVITVSQPASGLVEMNIRFDPIDAYVQSIVIPVGDRLDGKGQMIVRNVPLDATGQWPSDRDRPVPGRLTRRDPGDLQRRPGDRYHEHHDDCRDDCPTVTPTG